MNLKALQDKLTALMCEADAIAVKSAPTAEDVARIKAIPGEMADIKSQIEAAQQIEAFRAWQKEAAPMLSLADPAAPAVKTDDPAPETSPAVKMWYAHRFKSAPAGAEQLAKELYSGIAANGSYEQLVYDKHQAFLKYLRTGAEDATLSRVIVLTPGMILNAAGAGVKMSSIKANMIEGSDELGGFIVPEEFREGMISRLPGMTVVRKRANVITVSGDTAVMTRVTGGNSRYTGAVRWSLVDEEPTATEAATNATFGQLRMSVYTAMGHTQVSKNLLEDAMFDLGGYLGKEFSESSAIHEDELFLVHSGAGGPQGILNGATANVGPHNSDITVVNSGAAAALTGDGIKKLPFGIAKQYRSGSAVFVMNKATLQAASLLKDGQGRYLVGDERLIGQAVPSELVGYTVDESEAMPDIAANVHSIIFGDFGGYTIADRVGMSIQRYDDSTTAKGNAVVFVARRRFGGQVTQGWRLAVQKVAA